MCYWELMNTRQYPVHVLGHQDNLGRELTRLERMNVEMDHLAKTRAQNHINNGADTPEGSFPKGFARIQIRGTPITCHLTKTLLAECTTPKLQQYWLEKNKLNPT